MQLYDICDYSKKFTAFTLIVVLQIVDRCILFALVVVHLISSWVEKLNCGKLAFDEV